MKQISLKHKIILSLFLIGLTIWLGGTIIRTAIAYDIYIPFTQLELKTEYNEELRNHNIYLFANTSIYTIVSYSVMLLSAIALLFFNLKYLKKKGWLFMCFVLFFLSAPFEVYSIILDINLLQYLRGGIKQFNDLATQDFIINKFQYLSIIQPMVFLAYFSGIIIMVFKPLDKGTNEKEQLII